MKDSTPIYSDFKKFLRHNDNKTELFSLIADKVLKFTQNISTTVISTKLLKVASNSKNGLFPLFPCNHEADNRIFVQLSHAGRNGIKRALIKTVDTDVFVIALAHLLDLEIDVLWVEFGTGKKKKWLPIHVYAQQLGKQKYLALLFWYAFTGRDSFQFQWSRKKNCLE